MDKFKNILIFGHSNIGDVCYDLAIINPLRETFPQSKISFVTSLKTRELAQSIAGIDEVVVFDKHGLDKGFFGYFNFVRKIRGKKFDLAIILRDIQMHYFFNIPKVIKIKKRIIRQKNGHPSQKYIKLLEEIGLKNSVLRYNFKFSGAAQKFADKIFTDFKLENGDLLVGIMPLAGWPLKCWPVENWNKLIDIISADLKAKVLVFGKTADSVWDRKASKMISPKAIFLLDKCTLAETMAVMARLKLFISPDTSLLHIASCMGIPSIGLYGATDTRFIYPLFDKKNMVVCAASLDCMPCYPGPKGGKCKVQNKPGRCMEEISVEQVAKEVRKLISS